MKAFELTSVATPSGRIFSFIFPWQAEEFMTAFHPSERTSWTEKITITKDQIDRIETLGYITT